MILLLTHGHGTALCALSAVLRAQPESTHISPDWNLAPLNRVLEEAAGASCPLGSTRTAAASMGPFFEPIRTEPYP